MVKSTFVLATVGLVLSCYAVYVEHKIEHKSPDEEFSSLCDIESIGASCSAVFALPEGHMLSYFGLVPEKSTLDLPNAALGMFYYFWHLSPLAGMSAMLTKFITVTAFSSSVFLAYQLTFVVNDLCLLCWSTHVINTSLLYLIVLRKSGKVKTA